MPPKVYLDASPAGDFRAMPAKGDGLAILKWVTSFPGNRAAGLPVVMGVICVSSARGRRAAGPHRRTGGHRAAHGRRGGGGRAGAGARGRAHGGDRGLRAARRVGGALPGRRGVRAGPGATTPIPRPAGPSPDSSAGRSARSRRRARVRRGHVLTPGAEPVLRVGDLHPGVHFNMLGADGPGKAEAEVEAVAALRRSSATSGSRQATAASSPGRSRRGWWRASGDRPRGGHHRQRRRGGASPRRITLFDSTGLAIQDLAICLAVLEAHRAGGVRASTARL